MLSHVVLFWTDPKQPDAPAKLAAAGREYLARVPGLISFHVGLMVPSHREVVDQTYQVGFNITVRDKAAEIAYQEHPFHQAFVKSCSSLWTQVKVYDFDGP